jgi:hypothetical protein
MAGRALATSFARDQCGSIPDADPCERAELALRGVVGGKTCQKIDKKILTEVFAILRRQTEAAA